MSKNVQMLLTFNELVNKLIAAETKQDLQEIAIIFDNKFFNLQKREFELEDDYLIDGFFQLYDEKANKLFTKEEFAILETFDTDVYLMYTEGLDIGKLIEEAIKMD